MATTQDSAAEKGDDGNGAEPTAENLEKAKGKDGEMMQSWLALQAILQRMLQSCCEPIKCKRTQQEVGHSSHVRGGRLWQ